MPLRTRRLGGKSKPIKRVDGYALTVSKKIEPLTKYRIAPRDGVKVELWSGDFDNHKIFIGDGTAGICFDIVRTSKKEAKRIMKDLTKWITSFDIGTFYCPKLFYKQKSKHSLPRDWEASCPHCGQVTK